MDELLANPGKLGDPLYGGAMMARLSKDLLRSFEDSFDGRQGFAQAR